MTRPRRTLLTLVLAGALLGAAVPAASAMTVYAAASLRDAFPQIDSSATFSFAGSNTLQLQVERGAPADLFASASPTEAQALFREGRCSRPVTFATNVLVLVTPTSDPGQVRSVYTLRQGGRRLAIGSAGVPIGVYTRKLLARLGLSSALRSNTVSQERDVASVTAKVTLGSADAGFVYQTDYRLNRDRLRRIALPRYAQPPVRYQACVVQRPGADTRGAQAFLDRLRGTPGRTALRRAGFGLPPRG